MIECLLSLFELGYRVSIKGEGPRNRVRVTVIDRTNVSCSSTISHVSFTEEQLVAEIKLLSDRLTNEREKLFK